MPNIIVTGASRGLGLGISRKLLQSGFSIIATARKTTPELDSLMGEYGSKDMQQIRFVPFDLSDVKDIPEMVKSIRKEYGSVFGLVNNAGISADGVLSMMKDSDIENVVRVNTLSPLILTKHVVRLMMADGGGRIVNISSITAYAGASGLAVYAATKASLLGFTRSLAREVGRAGVNVNAIAPGFIDTDLTKGLTQEHREKIERRSALRRLAEVCDVACTVDFLMSEGARNITGTMITVNAGNTA